MKTHAPTPGAYHAADARHFLLENAVVRAKQEHDLLKEELQDLYAQVCTVRSDEDEIRLNREIRQLNDSVKHFMKEWSDHTKWEESELFPYAAWYLGAEPDMFALMEQEYELAEQYIQAFLHTLDRAVIPVSHEEARKMASYLLQAYAFLKNRFQEEEEIMQSLTDRSNGYGF
ncbi:hemerythrin domain-containing protein [Cohnella silvisoli]|uniref:Hemerythrin domain-containing protein n=1 Tax=Cohnella silvisoli TaxID=2873699 RepID=A0ABV1KLJ8_9BACL|nr:hemerythrin domain-containing protein [Cohnella silvisoli]MCD9020683.1 hemerythrin domain-containing protein [Cohnella silvisoli]